MRPARCAALGVTRDPSWRVSTASSRLSASHGSARRRATVSAASVSACATGSSSSGCAGTPRAAPGKARAATRALKTCFWGARAPRRATTPRGWGWDNRGVMQGCVGERVCAQATEYGRKIPRELWMVPQGRGVRLGQVRRWEHQLHQRVLREGRHVSLGRVRGERHGGNVGLVRWV